MNDVVLHPIEVALSTGVRGVETRSAVLLEGPRGWGEWSPVPGFPCDPRRALQAALEAARGEWPAPVRDVVPVNALVGDTFDPERDGPRLAGYECVKVKVGDLGDVERVAAVRDVIGPHVKLRIDANGRWDTETAQRRLALMARYDLECVEQPAPTIEDLAFLRRHTDIPIVADECIRSEADCDRLRVLDAADAIALKVQACGGVHAALRWSERAGLPVVVTSMLETSVGLAAGLALAAALPDLPFACGLGTGALLARDVTADPLIAVDGRLAVRVPVVDPGLLARCAADALPATFPETQGVTS